MRGAPFAFGVAVAFSIVVLEGARDPSPARADPTEDKHLVDYAAVRFHTPETGGPARPRFISERILAFEARLEVLADQAERPLERHIRAAIERHIAEEMLAKLPVDRPLAPAELSAAYSEIGETMMQRVGGREVLLKAAQDEGIEPIEVDAMLRREAMAAIYIDRVVNPILKPSEEQLREVYRTASHPFRSVPFEAARQKLTRWLVTDRIRLAVGSYYQAARSRVKVTYLSR